MLRSDLCDYGDAYIVVKSRISVAGTNNANSKNRKLTLRKITLMFHLDHKYQKPITHLQTMHKILILLCE